MLLQATLLMSLFVSTFGQLDMYKFSNPHGPGAYGQHHNIPGHGPGSFIRNNHETPHVGMYNNDVPVKQSPQWEEFVASKARYDAHTEALAEKKDGSKQKYLTRAQRDCEASKFKCGDFEKDLRDEETDPLDNCPYKPYYDSTQGDPVRCQGFMEAFTQIREMRILYLINGYGNLDQWIGNSRLLSKQEKSVWSQEKDKRTMEYLRFPLVDFAGMQEESRDHDMRNFLADFRWGRNGHSFTHREIQQRMEVIEIGESALKIGLDYHSKKHYVESAAYFKISEMILDVLTSFTPGVSAFRDLYETLTGKNLITGEKLDSFSRTMAFVGVLSGGLSPVKYLSWNWRRVWMAKSISDVSKKTGNEIIVDHHLLTGILYNKSHEEIQTTIEYVRKHKIYGGGDADAISVTNAFMKDANLRIAKEDTKTFRYYVEGKSRPKAPWVTTEKLVDPQKELALPFPGPYNVKEWTIPKGSEFIDGHAAPNFNQPGGGYQILINQEFLQ